MAFNFVGFFEKSIKTTFFRHDMTYWRCSDDEFDISPSQGVVHVASDVGGFYPTTRDVLEDSFHMFSYWRLPEQVGLHAIFMLLTVVPRKKNKSVYRIP